MGMAADPRGRVRVRVATTTTTSTSTAHLVDKTAAEAASALVDELLQSCGTQVEVEQVQVQVQPDGNTREWVLAPVDVASMQQQRSQTLAIAALFYWGLAPASDDVSIAIHDPEDLTWTAFHDALGVDKTALEPRNSVTALTQNQTEACIREGETKLVDCRTTNEFLGMDADASVLGHLDGAVSLPVASIWDADSGAFLLTDQLAEAWQGTGVEATARMLVVGNDAIAAAAVATAAMLTGHSAPLSFSLVPLSDDFVFSLPETMRSSVFKPSEILFASGEPSAFDLSPTASTASEMSAEDVKELLKAYAECVKSPSHDKESESETSAQEKSETETLWHNADGHAFFNMPQPVPRKQFVTASHDIYRIVSFVLAPFGFPSRWQQRFSAAEVKSRCSALFQDAIEVCSDLVYQHRELTEGAMAMSVHRWVEQKRDAECVAQVRAINDLLETLYSPPVVVELPSEVEDDDHVLQLAQQLHDKLLQTIRSRTPWALPTTNNSIDEDGEKEDEDVNEQPQGSGWRETTYPSVVYALGFLPPTPTKSQRRKLSALQIKAFLQGVADAAWSVIGDLPVSQIQFQALCETVATDKRDTLKALKKSAETSMYAVTHALRQSLEREEELVQSVAAVRRATGNGDRALRSGRVAPALAFYSEALAQLPLFHREMAPLLVGRAHCFVQTKEFVIARQQLAVVLQMDPFSCDAYVCLGELDEAEAHQEQAMQHYVTAFILDGSRSPEHAERIDRVARIVGRHEARDLFLTMERQHELPTAWLVQSYFDSFEHDVGFALSVPREVETTLLDAPGADLTPDQLVYRAFFHHSKKCYQFAQRDVSAALARGLVCEDSEEGRDSDNRTRKLHAAAWNLHASFLYVAGDVHSALEAIATSLDLHPSSINSLVKKGGFLSETGEMEAATACFDEAIELDPNDGDIYLHKGQKELLEGDYYAAVQCLRRALARSEALPVTHVSYGMALYKSGSLHQAKDVFEQAAQQFPESPEVHLFYGDVLSDLGDYAAAMQHFVTALTLSPQCPLAFLNAGRVYVSTNDPMRAIAHFEQALAIDPRCSSAHLDIAQVLFAQGRTSEAFAHFDAAARCCRFLPEVEEVCAAKAMAKMQERVTDILGVDLRHIMRSK